MLFHFRSQLVGFRQVVAYVGRIVLLLELFALVRIRFIVFFSSGALGLRRATAILQTVFDCLGGLERSFSLGFRLGLRELLRGGASFA